MAAGSPDAVRPVAAMPAVPPPRTGGPVPGAAPDVPRGDLWEIPFAAEDLYELRRLVAGWAARETMPEEAADDLVLSVHEVATNSVRHGGGVGMLRLWRTGEELVCEIQDAGYIRDPLGPRHLPGSEAAASRGLWITEQICDLVEIASSPRGSQVRMHKRLD